MYRRHPGFVGRTVRVGTDAVLHPGARRAHRLIAATAVARAEVAEELAIDPERIAVIPHGAEPPPERVPRPVDTGGRRLVLAVGTNVPHKNHEALLRGLAARAEDRPLLAIAGHGTETLDARPVRRRRRRAAVRDGRRGELDDLYAAASSYITATHHEGFGLPVIEALARGLPVAASDIPVLREVAGELAVYFEPDDPAAVAAALGPLPDRGAAGRRARRALHLGRQRRGHRGGLRGRAQSESSYSPRRALKKSSSQAAAASGAIRCKGSKRVFHGKRRRRSGRSAYPRR